MRKFTLSVLVLLVSVFFMGQTALGQAMHSKTLDIAEASNPLVYITKSSDNFDFADMYSIDFEDEVEFTFDFLPWTWNDVDLLPVYGMTGITWPNSGDPQAFIVFNPDLTDPPIVDDPAILPHTGEQFGACLAAVPSGGIGNDDWFISDMVGLGDAKGASFTFWAKSYVDTYGLERFNVGVSTTGTAPADFTIISGGTYIEAPIEWTEYSFDLSSYAGQSIYVAIQCVSFDAFIFMIDDLVIDPGSGGGGGCENFDALAVGDYVAVELEGWTTWSNAPGTAEDALITDVASNSPDNSFVVEGTTDLVQLFNDENLTTGTYHYSNMMNVADGFCGYFNLQKDVIIGTEWGFQVMFDSDGTATVDAGAAGAAIFSFSFDTWYMNELIVDLDNDLAEYWFDGALVIAWPWSLGTFGTPGALTLGSANYYANAGLTGPKAYFDDVCFEELEATNCENFDALAVGDYVAVELEGWTTWSNAPGTAEDALITDVASNSPDNSFVVEGTTDLVQLFNDENFTTGKYHYSNMMNVADGFCGYFNLQKDVIIGTEWGFQVMFDSDGTATVDAGAAGAAIFSFSFDTWYMNELIVDLDNDLAEYWFDGALVIAWPWSLGTFGTPGALTLGSANYYAYAGLTGPKAYFDDVCFEEYVLPADCENFDALTAGGYVAEQLGGYWTTWSGGSADDAMVTDVQSNSPDNSFVVDAGAVDLIYQFGDDPLSSGQWLYSHYIYVPTGFSGYFNVQTEPTPGVGWNLELYFDDGGTGYFGGQSSETFVYNQDTWFLVEIDYDLDRGYGQVVFEGELIIEFVNELTIGSIDYYGANSGGDPGAFYDDVCFGPGWIITDIEDPFMSTNNTVVYPNPASDKITIESENIINEVRIYNNMGQLVYSGQFDSSQIMVNTSNFITGMYIVQVVADKAIEVRKLIIE